MISLARVILAAFALFAIWLDPAEPARHALTTYSLLSGYLAYALVLALLAHGEDLVWTPPPLVVHTLDLLIFALFIFLTTGPASPFFVFFVFSMICATMRWQVRGTVCTAIAALGIVLVVAAYQTGLVRDPGFEMDRFVIRIGYLLVVAALLAYMGTHEEKRHDEISRLASWPRTISEEISLLMRDSLGHASAILAAPRLLAVWEEEEEPSLHLAFWSAGKFSYTREPPHTFGSLVAEPLAGTDFLCRDLVTPAACVLHDPANGFRRWRGMPLDAGLQRRYSITGVLALSLRGEYARGRLFVLDKASPIPGDLLLGTIVAREVSCDIEHCHLIRRLRQTALSEERIRLAHDLHDGLLQSLTGTAVQLEVVRHLLEIDPQAARQRLLDIQRLVSSEQKNLRSHIQELWPSRPDPGGTGIDLGERLKELAERIESQWGPRVTLAVRLQRHRFLGIAREVYFIVHEALVNAARHANASAIRAEITSGRDAIEIVVSDNGCGFPFRGRHDLAALTLLCLGPLTLRERVRALRGSLVIESSGAGSRLEIALPTLEGSEQR